MPKKPVWEWESTYPAQRITCPNCGYPVTVRSKFYGRFRTWVLKGGRGWRKQGVPTSRDGQTVTLAEGGHEAQDGSP